VSHQRVFTRLPAKDAVIDVECEARDAEQIARLVDTLHEEGFSVDPVAID
jgi:threonine dehydratase